MHCPIIPSQHFFNSLIILHSEGHVKSSTQIKQLRQCLPVWTRFHLSTSSDVSVWQQGSLQSLITLAQKSLHYAQTSCHYYSLVSTNNSTSNDWHYYSMYRKHSNFCLLTSTMFASVSPLFGFDPTYSGSFSRVIGFNRVVNGLSHELSLKFFW